MFFSMIQKLKKAHHRLRTFIEESLAATFFTVVFYTNIGFVILNFLGAGANFIIPKDLFSHLSVQQAQAVSYRGGIFVQGAKLDMYPGLRSWNGTSLSVTTSLSLASGVNGIVQSRIKSSPVSNESIYVVKSARNTAPIDPIDVYHRKGGQWTKDWSQATNNGFPRTRRNFDVAYENVSGRAIVAYSDFSTAVIKYRVYDPATESWSSELNVSTTLTATSAAWIQLESRPGTDEIALIYSDRSSNLNAIVSTGCTASGCTWAQEPSSLIASSLGFISTATYRKAFDAKYLSDGRLLIVWGTTVAPYARSIIKDTSGAYSYCYIHTSGCATSTTILPATVSLVSLAVESSSTQAVVALQSNSTVLNAAAFNGTQWSVVQASLDTTAGTTYQEAAMSVNASWVKSGSVSQGIVFYLDRSGTGLSWYNWNSSGGATSFATGTDIIVTPDLQTSDGRSIETYTRPDVTDELMVSIVDAISSGTTYPMYLKNLTWTGAAGCTSDCWTVVNTEPGGVALGSGANQPMSTPISFAYHNVQNDLTVSATGTNAVTLPAYSIDTHIGGGTGAASTTAIALQMENFSGNLTSITLTETNSNFTVSQITDVKMFYDTNVTNCSYDGDESFVTTTISGETLTFAFNQITIPAAPSSTCLYMVFDTPVGSGGPKGGQVMELEVSNPFTDINIGGETIPQQTAVDLATVTFVPTIFSVSYGNSLYNGARTGETVTISGNGFGTPSAGSDRSNCAGAVDTGCVRFVVGGNATVDNADISYWTNDSITFTISGALGTTGGYGALDVVAGGQSVNSKKTYFIHEGAIAATSTGSGRVVYGNGSSVIPQERTWDGSTLSSASSLDTITGNSIFQTRLASSPTRNESIVVTQDNVAGCKIFTQRRATTTWTLEWSADIASGCSTIYVKRYVDVAYENVSGRAIVAYGGGINPVYRVYDPSTRSWSSEQSISVTHTTNTIRWVKLVERPNSNEIALVYADEDSRLNVVVSTGCTDASCNWGQEPSTLLENDLAYISYRPVEAFDAVYLADGRLMVVWGSYTNAPKMFSVIKSTGGTYSMCYFNTLGCNQVPSTQYQIHQISLAVEPGGNRVVMGGIDFGSGLSVAAFDGAKWAVVTTRIDTTVVYGDYNSKKNVAAAWVKLNSISQGAVFYNDSSGGTGVSWYVWNASDGASSFSAGTDLTVSPSRTESSGKSLDIYPRYDAKNEVMLAIVDGSSGLPMYLKKLVWTGASGCTSGCWSLTNADGGSAVDGTAAGASNNSPIAFAYDRTTNNLAVDTVGSFSATVPAGTSTAHIGGGTGSASTSAFTLQMNTATSTLTNILITQATSTLDLANTSNARLYYDVGVNSCSYDANESYISGTISTSSIYFETVGLSISKTPRYTCLYLVLDVTGGADGAQAGETLLFKIANPTSDIVIEGGVIPASSQIVSGVTATIRPAVTSITYGEGLSDGARKGDTVTITGHGFGAPSTTSTRQDCSTAALDYGCIRFVVGGDATVSGYDISSWTNTSITFVVTSSIATSGGSRSLQLIAAGQSIVPLLDYIIYSTESSMPVSGELYSAVFDTGDGGAAYNAILWNGSFGSSTGRVLLQLATSNSTDGPWSFVGGSTCGSNDWYEPGGPGEAVEITCSPGYHNNERYFRYRIQLCSDADCSNAGDVSPVVDEVVVNWSP